MDPYSSRSGDEKPRRASPVGRSGIRSSIDPSGALRRISDLKLLDQVLPGLLRDEGAVEISEWVGDELEGGVFSGNAYGCERRDCSRCIDLREREECTRTRDRNRPVLQHPKITNSTARLPAGAAERAVQVPRSQSRLHHRPWGSGQHSLAVEGAKSIPTRFSCRFRCRWRERGPGAVSRGESLRGSGGDRVSASEVVSGRTVMRVRAPVDSCCADRPVREGDQNAPSIHGRPRDSPVTIARAMRCARRRGSGRSDLPRVARTRAAQASQLPPAEAA